MATYSDKPKRDFAGAELAGLGERFLALIIDGIILGIVTGVLTRGGMAVGGLASFVVGVIYYWYFLTQNNGQTPGKKIMGVRVVKVNGQPLNATDAVIRYIGYYIDSFFIMLGWIWAIFDRDSQAWHDKLAGTVVVRA